MLIWGIAILFNVIGLFTRSAFLYFVSIVGLIVSSVYLGNKLSQIAHDMDVVSDKIEQISMGNLTNELFCTAILRIIICNYQPQIIYKKISTKK